MGGEQAGKSFISVVDFVVHLFEGAEKYPAWGTGEPLLYWLVAADYDRTKAEFGFITEFLERLGLNVDDRSKVVNPGWIDVRRTDSKGKAHGKPFVRIETKSGKDPRTLSMFAPNGIIGCEASQLDLETYDKCLARIAPKNGWLHLSGTLEGSLGWYPGLASAWLHGSENEQSFRLPSPTNWHRYPQGLETPSLVYLKEHASSDAFFLERIMGIASPPRGLVFSEFRADIHIRELEYMPEEPVFISHDPGYGHANAIEAWQIAKGGQIRVFDELYERGIGTADLIDTAMKREWWKNEHKTLVVDPNYVKQHHSGPSMGDIWLTKTGLVPMGHKVRVAEGIERLKSFLKVDAISGQPGIVWAQRCKGVLSELGAYPNPFDGQTHVYSYKLDSEGNVVGEDPDPRWNDGLSATMYGIVERFGLVTAEGSKYFTTTTYGPPKRDRLWSNR